MESGTQAIVELAWARVLGLEDDAFDAEPGRRLTRVDESVVTFVSLGAHRVLVGPAWLLDRAAEVDDPVLASGPGLLGLTARPPAGQGAGRLLHASVLAFTDAYVDHPALESAVVADDPQAVHDLERECPPDDVTQVGLAALAQRFVVLDDREAPVAGSGYGEQQGILADLGVLTPPALRREGHGLLAGALAVNDALDSGLVAQWRSRADDVAAAALGRRLGFAPAGTQTTLLLPGTPPG